MTIKTDLTNLSLIQLLRLEASLKAKLDPENLDRVEDGIFEPQWPTRNLPRHHQLYTDSDGTPYFLGCSEEDIMDQLKDIETYLTWMEMNWETRRPSSRGCGYDWPTHCPWRR